MIGSTCTEAGQENDNEQEVFHGVSKTTMFDGGVGGSGWIMAIKVMLLLIIPPIGIGGVLVSVPWKICKVTCPFTAKATPSRVKTSFFTLAFLEVASSLYLLYALTQVTL